MYEKTSSLILHGDIAIATNFIIVTGDGLVSGFDGKYKAHSFFIVSRLSS